MMLGVALELKLEDFKRIFTAPKAPAIGLGAQFLLLPALTFLLTLILRPPTLTAGIGCNRDTAMQEMKALLERVFEQFHISLHSLIGLASIRLKADEAGLLLLAENMDLPLYFYDRQELNQVKTIENPSLMVEKHVGVKSVCEAAAILAAKNGTLLVPKHSTKNATVALARIGCSS